MDKQTQKFVNKYGEKRYTLILFLRDRSIPIRYIAKIVEMPQTTVHYWITIWQKWNKNSDNSGLPKP